MPVSCKLSSHPITLTHHLRQQSALITLITLSAVLIS